MASALDCAPDSLRCGLCISDQKIEKPRRWRGNRDRTIPPDMMPVPPVMPDMVMMVMPVTMMPPAMRLGMAREREGKRHKQK